MYAWGGGNGLSTGRTFGRRSGPRAHASRKKADVIIALVYIVMVSYRGHENTLCVVSCHGCQEGQRELASLALRIALDSGGVHGCATAWM